LPNDKVTIGLTATGRATSERIMESGLFQDQLEVARLAMAVAIRLEVPIGEAESAETVWSTASFDPGGRLSSLISVLYPNCEAPYRLIEHLIARGLEILGGRIAENGRFDILDTLELASPVPNV